MWCSPATGMSQGAHPAGVLLPASTLTTQWFLVFALVVAFNTVIYLGLTMAKLVPWPAQIHPSRVRAVLPRIARKENVMNRSRRGNLSVPDIPDRSLRAQAALSSIPRAFALLGILVIIIALIILILDVQAGTVLPIGSLVFGVVLVGVAPLLSRPTMSLPIAVWAWTATLSIFVVVMSWNAIQSDSAISLTYGVVGMTLLPAVAMSWPASFVAGAICLPAIIAAGAIVDVVSTPYWVVAAIAGYVVGLISLQVRLVGLDRLALEQERFNTLSTTDPLTGTLSRHGLLTVAPVLASAVERTHDELHIALIELKDLRSLNADYGLAYGDAVLIALARAIQSCLAEGDVLSRWSGNQFLALGIGSAPSPAAFRRDVEAAVVASGVALGKRPVTLTVSMASGDPQGTTLEALVDRATSPRRAKRASADS